MELNFDKRITANVYGKKVRYGIIEGNEKILFIKTGAGGKIEGFNKKYLKMARKINKKLGATVICAPNPDDVEIMRADEALIKKMAEKHENCQIYFLGSSDGGDRILTLAKKFPQTVKALGINPSIKTIEDFLNKLKQIPQVEKTIVYGSNDELFYVASELEKAEIENLTIKIIDGADHEFTDMIDEFISLIELF